MEAFDQCPGGDPELYRQQIPDFPQKISEAAPFWGAASQSVKKVIFDRLPEVKEAPKTSKPKASAYKGTVVLRFAQEVKTPYIASFL